MAQANILINSLNTGEVSGLIESRSDLAKYASACTTLENAVPLVEGGAKKMPGTYFAGATANGGAMFTGSVDSGGVLTVTFVNYGSIVVGAALSGAGIPGGVLVQALGTGTGELGTYYLTGTSGAISSRQIQASSIGKSRLVPFQFSTDQGAILELSAGIIRIWEGATQGSWSLGLAIQAPSASTGGGTSYTEPGNAAFTSVTGGISNSSASSSGFPSVSVSTAVNITVPLSISISLPAESLGGGSAVFQASYDGGSTWPQTFYTYGNHASISFTKTVTFSTTLLTNLDNLQFQVLVTASSGGVTPPTASVTASYGPCTVAVSGGTGTGSEYDPATAYASSNIVIVGPTAPIYNSLPPGPGVPQWPILGDGLLYITAPYGTSNAGSVPISFTVNGTDALSVTVTGTSPNQGINIALANTTASLNSASLIQTAIRALVSLNSLVSNYVSLAGWTVTPDPIYYATPWITAPQIGTFIPGAASWIAECILANQYDQFPLSISALGLIGWNTIYWQDGSAQLESAIELVTPYLEADLFALDCSTQSADVLWIFHPSYPPAVIERLSANSWQYSLSLPGQEPGEPAYRGTLDVVKTGYSALGQNISLISQSTTCTVVLASSTGAQPFSVGSRIYINLCSGLVELNEGEFIVASMAYGSVSITVVDSTGTSSAITANGWYMTLQDPNTGSIIDSSSYLQYAGGGFAVQVVALFAVAGDYPSCGTLYQERLCVGGSNNNPTQINGSVEDDYPDFITDPNEDDYAFQFTLVSNQVNQLLNMIGTPNGLAIGTSGGVWIVTGSNGGALSQTNVNAQQQTTQGVSALQPQLVQGSAIFVSRSARIVTFLSYNFVTNQWDNIDLTRLNRTVTIGTSAATSGIAQTAFQAEPYPIFWAVRNDGQLIGLVFNTQDQVYAWFRVNMVPGGGLIESVAVVSGQNQEDQVVVVVNRTIEGVTQRYVEYFMPQELFGQLSNAFFVHCGLQFQGVGPFGITGITQANPAVVTAPGHTLNNGMSISITAVEGMTQANTNPLAAWTVAGVSGQTFQLQGIDSTGWGAYTSGGAVEQVTNQLTGMSYLLGQTVVAVGDEQVIFEGAVAADTLNFGSYANQVTIGVPFTSTIQPLNPVLGGPQASSKGKKQKFSRVTLSLYESVGGQYGTDTDHLYDISYGDNAQGNPPTLFTGNLTRDLDGEWGNEDTILIVHSDPYPYTLRAVAPRLSVAEEG